MEMQLVLISERIPRPVSSTGGRFLGSSDRGYALCPKCGLQRPLVRWQARKARGLGLDAGDLGDCPRCGQQEGARQ